MKKTIKINLSGMVFHIDEDAFEALQKYLNQLEDRFSGTNGDAEILADIENRLAELFREKIADVNESVSLDDVNEAIAVLGNPEEIGEMAGEDDTAGSEQQTFNHRGARRMYRDTDSRVVGGVCSGLGEYLNVDPVIFRILFIVFTLTYGVGILLYVLLWIAVPEARTRAEKMEMRGEHINIANIERTVRREFEQVKDNINNQSRRYSNAARRAERRAERRSYVRTERPPRDRSGGGFFHALASLVVIFFKIIGAIIGFAFLIAGVSLLVLIIGTLISGNLWFHDFGWNFNGFSMNEIVNLFLDETVGLIAIICVIILIAIPVLSLIYGGVKLLFNFRANDRAVALSSTITWVVALIALAAITVSEASRFSNQGRAETEKSLAISSTGTLYLQSHEDASWGSSSEFDMDFGSDLQVADVNGQPQLVGHPRVDIEYTNAMEASIRIVKISRGQNMRIARENAEEIIYSHNQRDSILLLDRVFRIPESEKFTAQEVEVEILLPAGTSIFIDESMRHLLYMIDNTDDRWSRQMVGETWIMTPNGLSPLKSE